MEKINIGDRLVGEGEPCFIIAEAGVNHNGNIELAKKLVNVAKNAGADAIKFQTFKAEGVVSKYAEMTLYQKKNIRKKENQQEILKSLELSYKDFKGLKKYCDKTGIIFLSTPHSEDAIGFLESLVPAYKVSSGDLTNILFLQKVAKRGKPIILSTGMATMKEVKEALNIIHNQNNKEIVTLHCTTNYPCPLNEVNLRAMQAMQKELNCLVGYSDHTLGIDVSIAAVILGAVVIEKHFTLDRKLPGPDHKASLEPKELKELVRSIRDTEYVLKQGKSAEEILKNIKHIEKTLGNEIKKPTKTEEKIKKITRKSIVSKVDIPKGTVVTRDMITVKRPGTGIEPKYLESVIGRRTKREINEDETITWEAIK